MSPCAAVLLSVLHAGLAPWAEGGPSRGEDLVVSLAIFGPGDDVSAMGGHVALAVVDTRLEQGRLYNFGVVEFSPDLMLSFVLGKLDFHADEASILGTYQQYQALDRDVRVLVLNLPPPRALEAARALATGVLPENRTYRYHHFDDNCATRPRDILDRALGGALARAGAGPARMSLRDHARRYTRVRPLLSVWLDYMQNDSVDRPVRVYDEAFLPDELERQLEALVVDGQPVVKQRSVLYTSQANPPAPPETPRWGPWLLLGSLLCGAAVLALSRRTAAWARKARGAWLAGVGVGLGTSGLLLFVLGTFTEHLITHHNENLFYVSPLTLALLPVGLMTFRGHPRAAPAAKWVTAALAAVALVGLALKLWPAFDQQNWNIIALTVPATLLTALAHWRRSPSSS